MSVLPFAVCMHTIGFLWAYYGIFSNPIHQMCFEESHSWHKFRIWPKCRYIIFCGCIKSLSNHSIVPILFCCFLIGWKELQCNYVTVISPTLWASQVSMSTRLVVIHGRGKLSCSPLTNERRLSIFYCNFFFFFLKYEEHKTRLDFVRSASLLFRYSIDENWRRSSKKMRLHATHLLTTGEVLICDRLLSNETPTIQQTRSLSRQKSSLLSFMKYHHASSS